MAAQKLDNYLRAYRRKTGLTQREMALVLGFEKGSQVSRYEKRVRIPPLAMAFACEAVFGVPVSKLFAGMSDAAHKAIGKRLLGLRSKLQTQSIEGRSKAEARQTARKLEWLAGRLGSAAAENATA